MISLLLAMSAAVESPRIVTLPKRARVARSAPARKRAGPRQRPAKTAKLCVTGSCTPAAASPYRLADTGEARFSAKLDVVGKANGMACGVQGAPVCPSRGRRLTSVPID